MIGSTVAGGTTTGSTGALTTGFGTSVAAGGGGGLLVGGTYGTGTGRIRKVPLATEVVPVTSGLPATSYTADPSARSMPIVAPADPSPTTLSMLNVTRKDE